MTTQTDDTTLRALAAAVKDVRVPTSAAWARVCVALASPKLGARPLCLRPMMASLTVVMAFFVFSQFGLIQALVYPTVTAGVVPGPYITASTPIAGLALPVATITPQPASASDVAPIPLPPAGS